MIDLTPKHFCSLLPLLSFSFQQTLQIVAYLTAAGKKSLKWLVVAVVVSSCFDFFPHVFSRLPGFILNLQKNTKKSFSSVWPCVSRTWNSQKDGMRRQAGSMQLICAYLYRLAFLGRLQRLLLNVKQTYRKKFPFQNVMCICQCVSSYSNTFQRLLRENLWVW